MLNKHKKMISLVSRETPFGQSVSELVYGVNIFDLDFGFQIDSVKQPIKSNSVSLGHMSHCGTSSLNYHFDHGFVALQRCTTEIHLEKNVCWWVRNTLHSTAHHFVFF